MGGGGEGDKMLRYFKREKNQQKKGHLFEAAINQLDLLARKFRRLLQNTDLFGPTVDRLEQRVVQIFI